MQLEQQNKIKEILTEKYPAPETELKYNSPFELLVATILSAQTTDKQVNKVTSKLFIDYNKPEDFASLTPKELQEKIKSIGLYRNKAKFIIKTSQKILEDYQGKVPADFSKLLELTGVGRKTASVVLCSAFDKPAFPVDTHVFRVAKRLGLATGNTTEKVEKELKDIIPKKEWGNFHHRLIFHGREVCKARNPACSDCRLNAFCQFYQQ